MTKDVVIKIRGLQNEASDGGDSENEAVEVITSANYFFKNGKHYIVY